MTSDEKIWAIVCHLSLLLGAGFLLPLIVWLVKKDTAPVTAAHAREALNFHLSLYLYGLCCVPLCLLFCLGYFLIPALAMFGLICAIMAAVEAWKGSFFRYPLTIPFFR